MTFLSGKWKTPVEAPCLDRRADKKSPVWVLRDGRWQQFPGPLSLEQYYGRTADPMAWQPRGNIWEPPVSYWTKAERAERLAHRRRDDHQQVRL